jgi:hypothetical protein
LTWPTALPVAALRVLRTAAARRALQVAVLVGGLFTLGFLCGEQAHAADGVPLAPSASVTSRAVVPADPVDGVRSRAQATVGRLGKHKPTAPILRPLTGGVVRSLGERVVRPVGGLVETVTAELGKATAQLPPASPSPAPPSVPSVPSTPGLPVPGQKQTTPVPVGQAPQAGGTEHPATGGSVDGGRSAARASANTYGPRAGVGGARGVAMARAAGPQVAGPGIAAPAHQVPDGTPTSALAATSAVDDGTPRHGDGHAVVLNHRAPLRLAPGSAVRAAAAETRDRHRDIAVFPA